MRSLLHYAATGSWILAWSGLGAAVSAQGLPVSFEDVTLDAGIAVEHRYRSESLDQLLLVAGGVAGGDINGDGWPDLYVVGGDAGRQHLFVNRGDGTFSEQAVAAGVDLPGMLACGPAFADIDGDGDLDLFVGMIPSDLIQRDPETPAPALFRNDGVGGFTEISREDEMFPWGPYVSASFGDFDGDGHLDLFTSHWGMIAPFVEIDHLWRNDGHGSFVPATEAAGIVVRQEVVDAAWAVTWSFAANFADIDSDGKPDLLLASDFELSQVFRNLGNGRFADISTDVLTDENAMGPAVGDFDNDGHLDWFVSSIYDPTRPSFEAWGVSGNRLYRNLGDGTFEDVTEASGVRDGSWGWGACAADFDNDGWLDIFHVTGWESTFTEEWKGQPARLFMNNGDGTFTEQAVPAGIADRGEGRGVVCFDYDRDGDIDVFIGNIRGPVRLYRNLLDGRANFLQVKLVGRPPNTEGIGARVHVRGDGAPNQMRELRAGSNYVSQDPAVAHFGLGDQEVVDELEIVWPAGGRTRLHEITANRHLVVYESDGDANCDGRTGAADLSAVVGSLARGPSAASCPGGDMNYDGALDAGDVVWTLARVFGGVAKPNGSDGSEGE